MQKKSESGASAIERAIRERPQLYSSSTYKAMTVIEELASVPDNGFVSKVELSRRTGLDKSALYRILNTLSDMGYLDKVNAKYRLGLKFLALTQSVVRHYDLREIAHPFMVELAQEVGERVFLTVLDHMEVVQIDIVEGNPWVRVTSDVGTRFPAHASSAGKLFLADMPEEDLMSYLEGAEMTPVATKTVTDRDRLLADVRAARSNQFAVSDEESRVHERAISVPIRDQSGRVVACLGVAGTLLTFTVDKMMGALTPLRECVTRIAAAPRA